MQNKFIWSSSIQGASLHTASASTGILLEFSRTGANKLESLCVLSMCVFHGVCGIGDRDA